MNSMHQQLEIPLKEGRFFSKDFSTDSLSVVLNEKAVAEMGLKKSHWHTAHKSRCFF